MRKYKSKIKAYVLLKSEISRILSDIDPIGISMGPADEYMPEAELIVKEIKNCKSVEETYILLFRVFVEMFGADFTNISSLDKLQIVAQSIYDKASQNLTDNLRKED